MLPVILLEDKSFRPSSADKDLQIIDLPMIAVISPPKFIPNTKAILRQHVALFGDSGAIRLVDDLG
jgi:hypothetical protein